MNIAKLIIPLIVLFVLSYGIYKKVDIFDTFIEGSIEGIKATYKIFPTIFAFLISVTILIKSNIITDFLNILTPILQVTNFPVPIIPLAILRSISGSSSLSYLVTIFSSYQPDSFIGKVSSVIQGSTDTTIYILSVYFKSIGITKTKYALPLGLITDLFTCIIAYIVVTLFQ